VEDDAKLQDEKSGNLLTETLLSRTDVNFIVGVFGKLLLVCCCRCLGLDLKIDIVGLPFSDAASNGILNVDFGLNAVFDFDITFCAEVEEEDDYDRGENYGRAPGVVCPSAGHANAGVWTDFAVCWVEEMDEGCCDDDAGAKVSGRLAERRSCGRLTHRAKR
jgi:hypothetical protein